MDDTQFPLGVYPVEPMHPKQGYSVLFEAADGDEEAGTWEAWPDRYVFDVVVTAERLPALCRALFGLLPLRIYPILDVIGHDAYREIDPYISWDLLGLDRFFEALIRYHDFFFEEGMTGFGAMLDDPFLYVFVDEHKIVTIRAEPEYQARIERVLAAFDLEPMDEPAGADAASHEHRSVLLAPEDHPDLLSTEEVVEALRDEWRLSLNVEPDNNVDEDGRELGVTAWRCLVRVTGQGGSPAPADAAGGTRPQEDRARYAEVLLYASCLTEAEQSAYEAAALELDRIQPSRSQPAEEHGEGSKSAAPATTEITEKDPPATSGSAGPAVGDAESQSPADASPSFEFAEDEGPLLVIVSADRMTQDQFGDALRPTHRGPRPAPAGPTLQSPPEPEAGLVCRVRWL